MSDILYKYTDRSFDGVTDPAVRWLDVDDYGIFAEHLKLCGQSVMEKSLWQSIYGGGDRYAGCFVDGVMVSRACVEKYSTDAWEVADVRTARLYRNNGCAGRVSGFVLAYILENGRTPTMRTDADNSAMQAVIERLGFEKT